MNHEAGRDPTEPGCRGERGAAVVELLVVFLTLLVPLVYVMVVMADVQRALLATSSAAREAGRVYVTGSDRWMRSGGRRWPTGRCWAPMGCVPGTRRRRCALRVGCPDGVGSGCVGGFGPGAEVQVVVTYRVPVARLPFLGAVAGPGRDDRGHPSHPGRPVPRAGPMSPRPPRARGVEGTRPRMAVVGGRA